MPGVKYRKRFGTTLTIQSYDTLLRYSDESMIDRSKILNKALDEYFERNGIELRLNTDEENERLNNK